MAMDGAKIQLGAFDCAVDGWINTDVTPHLTIARIPFAARAMRLAGLMSESAWSAHRRGQFAKLRYVDLTRRLPFADAGAAAFFSSHVFEHLFIDEVRPLIAEIHRCLKPGGVCRVVVPDLEKIMATYDAADPEPFLVGIYEIGARSAVKNAHHSGFTGAYISRLFREAGFSQTAVLSYREGRCPDLDKLDNRPDSLFFEAVK